MRKINYSTYQKKVKELNSKIENLEYFVRNRLYDYEEIKIDNFLGVFNSGLNPIYIGLPDLVYDFHRLGIKIKSYTSTSLVNRQTLSVYKHKNDEIRVSCLGQNNKVINVRYKETENSCVV